MQWHRGQLGQVIIFSLIFMVVILVVVGALLGFVSQNVVATRKALAKEQALQLADAGIDKAVWQLNQTAGAYAGETDSLLATGVFDVSVTNISGSLKEITSTGYVPNKTTPSATSQVKVRISIGTTLVSFNYGMHIGAGGLLMENTSKIIGSVYSNGNIDSKQSSEITADAFAASTSEILGDPFIGGSAWAYKISNTTIGGNASSTTALSSSIISGHAYADTITGSNITGNAYYFTSIIGSTVGGSLFPGTPPPSGLPVIPFPISDAQVNQWEVEAEAGGIYTGPCPFVLSSGSTNLGPLKINCDFKVQNDAIVIVNGPIWVVGNFEVQNTAQVKLAPSYGNESEKVIVDNPSDRITSSRITVQNSAQILGSGTSGSYLMLISQNNSAELGGNQIAIQPKNGADASIYYAAHGKLLIENSTALKEATAYAVHMKNSSTLTYETGLASTQFSSGPGGSWQVVRGTWRKIK